MKIKLIIVMVLLSYFTVKSQNKISTKELVSEFLLFDSLENLQKHTELLINRGYKNYNEIDYNLRADLFYTISQSIKIENEKKSKFNANKTRILNSTINDSIKTSFVYKRTSNFLIIKGYQYHLASTSNTIYYTLMLPINKYNENDNNVFFESFKAMRTILIQTNVYDLNFILAKYKNDKLSNYDFKVSPDEDYLENGYVPFEFNFYTFGSDRINDCYGDMLFIQNAYFINREIKYAENWKEIEESSLKYYESLFKDMKERLVIGFVLKI